jgi:hypothetical protein
LLARKLRRMAKMKRGPERVMAYQDFFEKVALAKKTTRLLKRYVSDANSPNSSTADLQ